MIFLKAGAETDKRDVDGHLAIELAPDTKVTDCSCTINPLMLMEIAGTEFYSTKRRTGGD